MEKDKNIEKMPAETEDFIKKIEETKNEKILEVLNYAIETQSKVELLVLNPPLYSKSTSSTAIVTPEKIENDCLYVITKHNSKIVIEFSRIKRVTIVEPEG